MLLQEDLDLMIEENRRTLERMTGASILITGATGFFGRWVVELLLEAKRLHVAPDLSIVIVSRKRDTVFGNKVKVIQKDVADISGWDTLGYYNYVLHMANDQGDPVDSYRKNLKAMAGILEYASDRSFRFLYTSSGIVYKPGSNTNEESVLDIAPIPDAPKTAYKATKIVSEYMLMDQARIPQNCTMTCIRPFTFFGPYLPLERGYAIGEFVYNARARNDIPLMSIHTTRSYMYPTDLVKCLLAVLVRAGNGSIYNVGDTSPVNLEYVADVVARTFDVGINMLSSGGYSWYIPATNKIKNDFDIESTISLTEGMKRWKKWLEQ